MRIPTIQALVNLKPQQTASNPALQFRVGQVLPATVVKVFAESQRMQLNIGGTMVQAQSGIALKPGQTLHLQVVATDRVPQLKIIETAGQQPLTRDVLVNNIAQQQSPALLSKQLMSLLANPNQTKELSSATRRLAQQIMANLPTVDQLTTPQGVKKALQESGIFLEAKLGSASPNQDPGLGSDLKANLLRLTSIENHTPKQTKTPRQNNDRANSPPSNEQLFNTSRNIAETAKGAISKIVIDQISSLPEDSANKQTWNLEIPFSNGAQAESIKLVIQREKSRRTLEHQHQWSVVLELNPPGLGRIQCKVKVSGNEVSSYFRAESEPTHELIRDQLAILQKNLQLAGLSPQNLVSAVGPSPQQDLATRSQELVDQHI